MAGRPVAAYLFLMLLAGCTSRAPEPTAAPPAPAAVSASFEGAPDLGVEVASTPEQRARGLMHRTELAAGRGMLFVFPGRTSGGFWMKNTLVPLSIAYVDGDRVVSVAEMTPCPPETELCPTYPAAGPYTSAVEAPAGFFPAHRVGPGAKVQLVGTLPAPR